MIILIILIVKSEIPISLKISFPCEMASITQDKNPNKNKPFLQTYKIL